VNILVTGGAGFIGKYLVNKLIKLNHFPIVIDNLSTGNISNLDPLIEKQKIAYHNKSITNTSSIQKIVKDVDLVIHLAAITSVDYSMKNPTDTNMVNVGGTLTLLDCLKDKPSSRFVFISSAAVYGQADKLPLTEECPTEPVSPYGASKLAAEIYLKAFSRSFDLNAVTLRLFNVYGKGQNDDYAGVITKFAQQLKARKPPIIYGDGNQTRDFVHVSDVVDPIVKSMEYSEDHKWGLFNIASGKPTSIKDLAELMIKTLGRESLKPIYTEKRVGDIYHSSVDIRRTKHELSFDPKIELQNGLRDLKDL